MQTIGFPLAILGLLVFPEYPVVGTVAIALAFWAASSRSGPPSETLELIVFYGALGSLLAGALS